MNLEPAIFYGIFGLIALWIGGEGLVRATTSLAKILRLSLFLVSLTLLAIATSGPELFVNIFSSLKGDGSIGLGNVLGANVTNIALIFAIGALFISFPKTLQDKESLWAYPAAFGISLFVLMVGLDGHIDRIEGLLLLVLYGVWMFFALKGGHHKRIAKKITETYAFHRERKHIVTTVILFLASIIVLAGGAELMIRSVSTIASAYRFSPLLIAATLVAFGTSLPELVTMLVSIVRKQPNIGSGTVFGSIVFNVTCIIGVSALIHPLIFPSIPFIMLSSLVLLALALAYPVVLGYKGYSKVAGASLLVVYVFFILFVSQNIT